MQELNREATGIQAKREMVRRYMSDMIISAAAKLFGTAGYHGASMEQIAREAGISSATIYQYFRNKHDLYMKVLSTVLDGLKEAAARSLSEDQDPVSRLRAFIRNRINFFLLNPALYKLLLFQRWNFILEQPSDEYEELAREYFEYLGTVRSLLEDLDRVWPLQGGLDLNKISYFLLEVTLATVFHRLVTGARQDLDEEVDLVLNLFLQGLRKRAM